ncbi:MAG: hypothetical protein LC797_25150 [Chloroflexi bacterium]|nr:hypothetical protein [Chloroflexota bacterium]
MRSTTGSVTAGRPRITIWIGEQQLADLVEQALPARILATGRGVPSSDVLERAREEVRTICENGLADLLLFAHEVGQFCTQRGIQLAARGSATASLAVWALGLSDLCSLDYDLDGGPRLIEAPGHAATAVQQGHAPASATCESERSRPG